METNLTEVNPLLDQAERKFFSEFLDYITLDSPKTSPALLPNQPSNTELEVYPDRRKRLLSGEDSAQKRAKRELLTADEKRVNHVVSEQKRRNVIRIGFQSLVDLVPHLSNSASHSKSTVLFKAAEYIEELKSENDRLLARLSLAEKQLAMLSSKWMATRTTDPSFPINGPQPHVPTTSAGPFLKTSDLDSFGLSAASQGSMARNLLVPVNFPTQHERRNSLNALGQVPNYTWTQPAQRDDRFHSVSQAFSL